MRANKCGQINDAGENEERCIMAIAGSRHKKRPVFEADLFVVKSVVSFLESATGWTL